MTSSQAHNVHDIASGAGAPEHEPVARTTDPVAPANPAAEAPAHPAKKWVLRGALVIALAAAAYFAVPWARTALTTVSTDDAYVNGHVTFLAPRVSGQVMKVFVDDNDRVKKGDVLVQLDKEPYETQVAVKKAAVAEAEADLVAANAQVLGQISQTRADQFSLQHSIETVNTKLANLRAAVATLDSKKATLELAKANFRRGEGVAGVGGISKEDLDVRRQTVAVDEAEVNQALQNVYALRVDLGLPIQPPEGKDLTYAPANLDQNFSSVRQALANLIQSGAQVGIFPAEWDGTPQQIVDNFFKKYPNSNLSEIVQQVAATAPALTQARAKLDKARRDLDQALLDLKYCDVVSEIDGVVTRRNVNPGNNDQAGQSLMAVRSLTEIWIDANFKETQLADLRIGQPVRCEVDMYEGRKEFMGRISGFTMGTGQTLDLLPPQNATGNFVKIVQRLPVRIELTDYDPKKAPLFVGLSVTPYVYYQEAPTGPHAGEVLQPVADHPTDSATTKP